MSRAGRAADTRDARVSCPACSAAGRPWCSAQACIIRARLLGVPLHGHGHVQTLPLLCLQVVSTHHSPDGQRADLGLGGHVHEHPQHVDTTLAAAPLAQAPGALAGRRWLWSLQQSAPRLRVLHAGPAARARVANVAQTFVEIVAFGDHVPGIGGARQTLELTKKVC